MECNIMSDIVERLRDPFPSNRDMERKEAADEIERLREKCNKQAMMLQRLFPDKFPNTPFIFSIGGALDENGMAERIYVVPAYGCDFSYVYEWNGKTVGPEW
jgi:hypothetical protein